MSAHGGCGGGCSKLNLAGELLQISFYDSIIVAANGLATVLPVGIGVMLSLSRLATEWLDSSDEPPRPGDVVRVLESPTDARCQNRLGRVVSVEDAKQQGTTMTVAVKLRTADRVKTLLLCRCFAAPESVEIAVDRSQVQRVAGKKETMRLLAVICKQCLICGRAARDGVSSEDDAAKTEQNQGQLAHEHFQHAVQDIETELEVVHELEDEVNFKQLALDKMRPVLEPRLQRHKLAWSDVENVVAMINLSQIKQILDDPEAFLQTLVAAAGPYAKRLALAKLRPVLSPHVEKRGLAWEDVVPAITLISSADELQTALDDPEAFVRELLASAGPVAKKIAAAKLRPKLEPKLAKHELEWADVMPALELMDTVEELEAAIDDPEAFCRRLLSAVGPVGKRIALAKLRPKLEATLATGHGLLWADALPALELVDSLDEIQAAVDDPEAFLLQIIAAAGPAAKAMLMAKLRGLLMPIVAKRGLVWEDIALQMEMMSSMEDLEQAMADPEAFLAQLT